MSELIAEDLIVSRRNLLYAAPTRKETPKTKTTMSKSSQSLPSEVVHSLQTCSFHHCAADKKISSKGRNGWTNTHIYTILAYMLKVCVDQPKRTQYDTDALNNEHLNPTSTLYRKHGSSISISADQCTKKGDASYYRQEDFANVSHFSCIPCTTHPDGSLV
jgi:hypothetical protein